MWCIRSGLRGCQVGSFFGRFWRTLLPPEFSRGYTRIFTPRAFSGAYLYIGLIFSGGMPQLFPARFFGSDYLFPAFSGASALVLSAPILSAARLPPDRRDPRSGPSSTGAEMAGWRFATVVRQHRASADHRPNDLRQGCPLTGDTISGTVLAAGTGTSPETWRGKAGGTEVAAE